MTAVSGRRAELLVAISARGGDWSLPDVQSCYRRMGWRPEDAEADLRTLVQAGDLAVTGEGAGRTWAVDLSGLTRGAW